MDTSNLIEIEPTSIQVTRLLQKRTPTTYVLRCEDWYKIGYTQNSLNGRIEAMRTGNPFQIRLVYAIQTERCKELEEALHIHFVDRKHYREWYKLLAEDEYELERFITDFLWQK